MKGNHKTRNRLNRLTDETRSAHSRVKGACDLRSELEFAAKQGTKITLILFFYFIKIINRLFLYKDFIMHGLFLCVETSQENIWTSGSLNGSPPQNSPVHRAGGYVPFGRLSV